MDVVELTKKLVLINSENPPNKEKQVADFLFNYLKDLGMNVVRQKVEEGRENIIAHSKKKEDSVIMLCGHMDTVPIGAGWKFKQGEESEGKLYGRGTADMKGGLAAIACAAENLMKLKLKRGFAVIFTVNEEVALEGAKRIAPEKEKLLKNVKWGLLGECSNNTLIVCHKGAVAIKIKCRGKAAHGSLPNNGVNAIYKAIEIIEKLKNLPKKKHEILGESTINIGTIKGGTRFNIVPDYCEFGIDRRLVPGELPEKVIEEIKSAIGDSEMEVEVSMPALEVSVDSEIVKICRKVFEKMKLDSRLYGKSSYTEAEIYKRLGGIDVINLGPGVTAQAHTIDEFVKTENLRNTQKIYEEIVKEVCK